MRSRRLITQQEVEDLLWKHKIEKQMEEFMNLDAEEKREASFKRMNEKLDAMFRIMGIDAATEEAMIAENQKHYSGDGNYETKVDGSKKLNEEENQNPDSGDDGYEAEVDDSEKLNEGGNNFLEYHETLDDGKHVNLKDEDGNKEQEVMMGKQKPQFDCQNCDCDGLNTVKCIRAEENNCKENNLFQFQAIVVPQMNLKTISFEKLCGTPFLFVGNGIIDFGKYGSTGALVETTIEKARTTNKSGTELFTAFKGGTWSVYLYDFLDKQVNSGGFTQENRGALLSDVACQHFEPPLNAELMQKLPSGHIQIIEMINEQLVDEIVSKYGTSNPEILVKKLNVIRILENFDLPASVVYRYKRWKLDDDTYLVARCELKSVEEVNNHKSVYSWDIIIQRVGNKLFFDNRNGSQLDLLSVHETSQELLPDVKDDIKTAYSLSIEAAYINQNFSQQVMIRNGNKDFSHVYSFRSHEHRVTYVVFVDEEEPFCISADIGGVICIWVARVPLDFTPRKIMFEQKDWRYSGIHSLAVSGSGCLYTGSGDKLTKAWSLKYYSLMFTMTGHKSVVSSSAVSSGILYGGSRDGTVLLWSLSDHNPLVVLGEDRPGNWSSILSLAEHGNLLLAGHENGCAMIWYDGILLKSSKVHYCVVLSISKNGKWLFTGGWGKTINIQELSGDGSQAEAIPNGSVIRKALDMICKLAEEEPDEANDSEKTDMEESNDSNENKDPTLWLTYDYKFIKVGEPGGISCHLKCTLEQKPWGILKKDSFENLDGYCSCFSCGKPIVDGEQVRSLLGGTSFPEEIQPPASALLQHHGSSISSVNASVLNLGEQLINGHENDSVNSISSANAPQTVSLTAIGEVRAVEDHGHHLRAQDNTSQLVQLISGQNSHIETHGWGEPPAQKNPVVNFPNSSVSTFPQHEFWKPMAQSNQPNMQTPAMTNVAWGTGLAETNSSAQVRDLKIQTQAGHQCKQTQTWTLIEQKMALLEVTTLEKEVEPLHQASITMDRRIVNRLSCSTAVHELCASTVEAFDSMMDNQRCNPINKKESQETACKATDSVIKDLERTSLGRSSKSVTTNSSPSALRTRLFLKRRIIVSILFSLSKSAGVRKKGGGVSCYWLWLVG